MGLLIAAVFAATTSFVIVWAREQPLVAVGRIMDETRLVRMALELEDRAQTTQAKEAARQATPRVYIADEATLGAITQSLEDLPRTLSSAQTIDDVAPSIRAQFALTPELLAAVKGEAVDGQTGSAWVLKVRLLETMLHRRPMLNQQTWQRAVQEGSHKTIELMVKGAALSPPVFRGEVINVDDKDALARALEPMARDSGFVGPLRTLVTNRLTIDARPTYTLDAAATAQAQNTAAESIEPVRTKNPAGQVIFQRGDELTQSQWDLFTAELGHFASRAEGWQRWLRTASLAAAACAVTLALAGYTALFCSRVRKNPSRMGGVALILLVALVVAAMGTAAAPALGSLLSVTPTIFVSMLICIAYDRRSALAYGLLHGLLVAIALRESVGTVAVMVTGIACVVWSLREIRDRHTLFRSSMVTALGVGLATVIFSLIERPLVEESYRRVLREVGIDAGLAAGGALLIGGITLFLLPLLERAFNVTTGMTLIDLRDPKQPLLRELQQRAPGTYNHSLNVAAIAEGAAEAIGGDSLLTYVGALYHDVGKMNKPEYFVENQSGGPNKHDKLSPAMSLLIVVGHVKDGIELAREFRLPPKVQHFIEAHHGTTLVEFFYHRARTLATGGGGPGGRGKDEPDDSFVPDEFEYRYPGPKPRTREAAILMIADAVESTARSMSEPTPSRIDALVRTVANKRLLDGQFDDCELTLKDLHTIVESVSRTVASMYHSRVAYPTDAQEVATPEEVTTTQPAVESKRA